VFQLNQWVAFFAATGMILGAAYMLWLYRRVVFGALTRDALKAIQDLRLNEALAFAPLVVVTILMGLYPSIFIRPMTASVEELLVQVGAGQVDNRLALETKTR
jgi:NADH-quinone oxidoreductase subunit M